ncbi:MAG: sigma-70 family RNA polymerase sigma factor [Planctomycetota bacterium]|nr:sigma-70 family RNA polymerase sigma factor [Planctomycetota bacterium]
MTQAAGHEEDLTSLRAQNAEAFTRLVASHQGIVLGLGQSLGFFGADLDDAAAEVFVAVYKSLPGFEGRSALSTWIYQIACRTMWKLREKRKRDRPQGSTEDRADPATPTPARLAEEADVRERLWAAVAELEPRQATAVELYYRRDWPLERIAETMGCPIGTVKTHLFRARERLRNSLRQEDLFA